MPLQTKLQSKGRANVRITKAIGVKKVNLQWDRASPSEACIAVSVPVWNVLSFDPDER